jgi:hypothetical protein
VEVNAEKTKYMVMSREQNTGQNLIIRITVKCIENMANLKYLGKHSKIFEHNKFKGCLLPFIGESLCVHICSLRIKKLCTEKYNFARCFV